MSVPLDQEIQALVEKDEAQLLRELGHAVLARTLNAGEVSPEEEEEEGRLYVEENADELRKAICGSYVARLIGGDDVSHDVLMAVAALGDLIASATIHVAPLTIAAYVLRIGIRQFCERKPQDEP